MTKSAYLLFADDTPDSFGERIDYERTFKIDDSFFVKMKNRILRIIAGCLLFKFTNVANLSFVFYELIK